MVVKLNADKLQAIRMSRNMTQSYVAERGDTTERYIRDLESGKKVNPSANVLCRICRVLGVSMDDVMEIQQEES